MLEERFPTADTRPGRFPWSTAILRGIVVFGAGMCVTLAAVFWDELGHVRGISVLALITVVVGERCANLRQAVSAWQLHYGKSVEYVARRVREHEDGLRFKAP